jgi:hypothetical protein
MGPKPDLALKPFLTNIFIFSSERQGSRFGLQGFSLRGDVSYTIENRDR